MANNLDPQTIYEFIVNDFESAWNSLALNPTPTGRGNFMFARQAMTLLEFISRLCANDTSETTIKEFSKALLSIDSKYFTSLPGTCANVNDFVLPYNRSKGDELLWALFDLVRNGQAHQYQQIIVHLKDDSDFVIQLSGVETSTLYNYSRSNTHLSYFRNTDKDIVLRLYPDWLFMDLKSSVSKIGLLNKGLSFKHLERGITSTYTSSKRPSKKDKKRYYDFDSTQLENSLRQGGHINIPEPTSAAKAITQMSGQVITIQASSPLNVAPYIQNENKQQPHIPH
jgi:hypothetical protein